MKQRIILHLSVKIFTVLLLVISPHRYVGAATEQYASDTPVPVVSTDSLEETSEPTVSVYLDCRECDTAFIRQEIEFVNYVRDRFQAQVHIFVTSQRTGSGGREFTLSFIGQGALGGVKNTLSYNELDTDTFDKTRKGLSEVIKLGLVPYVLHTSVAGRLSVNYEENEEQTPQANQDPWNNWVFEVYAGGYFEKESQQERMDIRYGFYATRVTEMWRIQARPYFNYNTRRFESDDTRVRTVAHRNGFNGYVIRGLTDHWSIGFFNDIISTTFDNLDLRIRVAPAIEYSLLPYDIATRKEITFRYRINGGYYNYIEETLFGKTEERLFHHSLEGNVRIRQPWGSIFASLEGSHYLHDFDKNRLEFFSSVNFQLIRGLSFNLSGNVEVIHDQLFLPRGDATLEEVLLSQKRLSTTFEVSGRVGFSYKFGSIYNNVVNTRL